MKAISRSVFVCLFVLTGCLEKFRPETQGNNAPIALAQFITTSQDTPASITLNASDLDNDALVYLFSQPLHGAIAGTGNKVTYTPSEGYVGSDSFAFSANDGTSESKPATIKILVNKVRPTIASFSPVTSSRVGGERLALVGTAFVQGTTISVGGVACTDVTKIDFTHLECTLPAHAPGTVNVSLARPDGETAEAADSFNYVSQLYLNNVAGYRGAVQAYKIQAGEGTPIALGAAFDLGMALSPPGSYSIAQFGVDASGKFAFSTQTAIAGTNYFFPYSVGTQAGLTLNASKQQAVNGYPVEILSYGNRIYVVGSTLLTTYLLSSMGSLTLTQAVSLANPVTDAALSIDGRYLFLVSQTNKAVGVVTFNVAGGDPAAFAWLSVPEFAYADQVVAHPSVGTRFYVHDSSNHAIFGFEKVGNSIGALANSPYALARTQGKMAGLGQFLFAAEGQKLETLAINQSTGALTVVQAADTSMAFGADDIIADPALNYLYATYAGGKLETYSVASDGSVTSLGWQPHSLGTAKLRLR